jgi:hypothetical protein
MKNPIAEGTHPKRDGTSPPVTGQSPTRKRALPEEPGEYIDGSACNESVATVGRELIERERLEDGIGP